MAVKGLYHILTFLKLEGTHWITCQPLRRHMLWHYQEMQLKGFTEQRWKRRGPGCPSILKVKDLNPYGRSVLQDINIKGYCLPWFKKIGDIMWYQYPFLCQMVQLVGERGGEGEVILHVPIWHVSCLTWKEFLILSYQQKIQSAMEDSCLECQQILALASGLNIFLAQNAGVTSYPLPTARQGPQGWWPWDGSVWVSHKRCLLRAT